MPKTGLKIFTVKGDIVSVHVSVHSSTADSFTSSWTFSDLAKQAHFKNGIPKHGLNGKK